MQCGATVLRAVTGHPLRSSCVFARRPLHSQNPSWAVRRSVRSRGIRQEPPLLYRDHATDDHPDCYAEFHQRQRSVRLRQEKREGGNEGMRGARSLHYVRTSFPLLSSSHSVGRRPKAPSLMRLPELLSSAAASGAVPGRLMTTATASGAGPQAVWSYAGGIPPPGACPVTRREARSMAWGVPRRRHVALFRLAACGIRASQRLSLCAQSDLAVDMPCLARHAFASPEAVWQGQFPYLGTQTANRLEWR
jgi:hypothetical protein